MDKMRDSEKSSKKVHDPGLQNLKCQGGEQHTDTYKNNLVLNVYIKLHPT